MCHAHGDNRPQLLCFRAAKPFPSFRAVWYLLMFADPAAPLDGSKWTCWASEGIFATPKPATVGLVLVLGDLGLLFFQQSMLHGHLAIWVQPLQFLFPSLSLQVLDIRISSSVSSIKIGILSGSPPAAKCNRCSQ